jgi:hypothetical protein
MQRTDPDGIVLLCDFCRRDWDGQEAMIEGHHGSILCLQCLKIALNNQSTDPVPDTHPATSGEPGSGKYKCTLCLRFNMPPAMPHWANPDHPDAVVCQDCLYQAAKAFHKSRAGDPPFTFDYTQYPPPHKLPKPTSKSQS